MAKYRRQRVVVDGEVSSWEPVLSGVLQGSVLWPILCLICINDLEEVIGSRVVVLSAVGISVVDISMEGISDVVHVSDWLSCGC